MKYRRSGLVILSLAFFALLFGISFVTGQNAHHGPGFSALGVGLVIGSITVLAITARRWAGYFCAICALGAIKAMLAMTVGYHTLSGTLEMIGPQTLVMLVILTALSYRFTIRLPRSRLESLALVSGVVAVAIQMLIGSNFWPVRFAAVLLSISWLVDRLTKAGASHQGHHASHLDSRTL
jgi:hypothetical protein